MDDPAADYAIIPTWFLARRARADVKVVLCGEGGDELFAGYGRYRRAMRPWWLGGRVMRGRGVFDRIDVLRDRPTGWRDGFAASEARGAEGGRTRLAAAQAADAADWLPHDLLLKLDRCLMAHGVEGRTPFLDPGRRRRCLPSAGRAETAQAHGQMAAAPLAGAEPAGGPALRSQARLHRAGRRVDQGPGRPPRPPRRCPARAWRRSPIRPRSRPCSAPPRRAARAWPHGCCCSMRYGIAAISRDCRRDGDVFETLATR